MTCPISASKFANACEREVPIHDGSSREIELGDALLVEHHAVVARTWTQIKAERHARGGSDPTRVARLKQEMFAEIEADGASTVRDVSGGPDEMNASDVDGQPASGDS